MRGVVPDQFQRARVLARQEFDLGVLLDRIGEVGHHAVERHRDGALGERGRDALRDVETGCALGDTPDARRRERSARPFHSPLLTRCLRMQVSVWALHKAGQRHGGNVFAIESRAAARCDACGQETGRMSHDDPPLVLGARGCAARGVVAGRAAASRRPFRPSRSRSSCRFRPAGRPTPRCASRSPAWRRRSASPIIVENVAGAAGGIGAQRVKQSEPDGHTLLQAASPHTTNAAVKPDANVDLLRDFVPIGQTGNSVYTLCASKALGVEDARRGDRARQGEARRAEDRQRRHRLGPSSDRRDAEVGGRHRAHPRAVSRRGAGHSRSGRRPHRSDVPHHRQAADRRRPGGRARRHRRRSPGSTCRSSSRSPSSA